MKGDRMNFKRLALGLTAMALIWIVGNELIGLFKLQTSQTIQQILMILLSTGVGAFIARRHFLLPAFALWLLIQTYVIYVLYMIAEPTGQASLTGILSYNWISLASSAVAIVVGVALGERLSSHRLKATVAT